MPNPSRDTDQTGSTGEVTRGTSIRPLARLLTEPLAVWIVGANGRVIYVSAACGRWLGIQPELLLGRDGVPRPDGSFAEFADAVVFSLRPHANATPVSSSEPLHAFVQDVHPPAATGQTVPRARTTLFVPIPEDDFTEANTRQAITFAFMAFAGVDLPPRSNFRNEDFSTLIAAVRKQLAAQPQLLTAPVMIGDSVWAVRLQRQVEAAAQTTTHVTLHCPRGGGGEMLARLIHIKRPAGQDNLLKVAGALMDAELFDAATGGLVNRMLDNSFESASMLISDLDQMPLDAQQRLALLLHNHGARLQVFATTMVLSKQLASVLLPELASQLGLIEITVPPLRDRIEDLPAMSAAMLHRRHVAGESSARQLGREALDRMVAYPWPGNYEELDAAIRGAARQCNGETIRVEHLPLAIRSFGQVESASVDSEQHAIKIVPLDRALADAERKYITAALRKAGGNRAAAARLLEISRGRLLRRIDQLEISDD